LLYPARWAVSCFAAPRNESVRGHEFIDGFTEREPVELHDQVDDTTGSIATHAVEQVLARGDHEGRFAVLVPRERAAADMIGRAVPFEFDAVCGAHVQD